MKGSTTGPQNEGPQSEGKKERKRGGGLRPKKSTGKSPGRSREISLLQRGGKRKKERETKKKGKRHYLSLSTGGFFRPKTSSSRGEKRRSLISFGGGEVSSLKYGFRQGGTQGNDQEGKRILMKAGSFIRAEKSSKRCASGVGQEPQKGGNKEGRRAASPFRGVRSVIEKKKELTEGEKKGS